MFRDLFLDPRAVSGYIRNGYWRRGLLPKGPGLSGSEWNKTTEEIGG